MTGPPPGPPAWDIRTLGAAMRIIPPPGRCWNCEVTIMGRFMGAFPRPMAMPPWPIMPGFIMGGPPGRGIPPIEPLFIWASEETGIPPTGIMLGPLLPRWT